MKFIPISYTVSLYFEIQSIWNTPPNALDDNPGGRIHWTGLASLRDSMERRAKPQNLPLSFTEKTSKTLRH